jgi:hypothetical protein
MFIYESFIDMIDFLANYYVHFETGFQRFCHTDFPVLKNTCINSFNSYRFYKNKFFFSKCLDVLKNHERNPNDEPKPLEINHKLLDIVSLMPIVFVPVHFLFFSCFFCFCFVLFYSISWTRKWKCARSSVSSYHSSLSCYKAIRK